MATPPGRIDGAINLGCFVDRANGCAISILSARRETATEGATMTSQDSNAIQAIITKARSPKTRREDAVLMLLEAYADTGIVTAPVDGDTTNIMVHADASVAEAARAYSLQAVRGQCAYLITKA